MNTVYYVEALTASIFIAFDEIVIIIGFFIKGVENKSLILVRNF